ncbi:MAG: hypothetical protein HYS86_04105, partial [Candidatus Chisholmbacteria bacterium]|nr:hypothetical protein [Candidatus Chisholmbacteria bacterium]
MPRQRTAAKKCGEDEVVDFFISSFTDDPEGQAYWLQERTEARNVGRQIELAQKAFYAEQGGATVISPDEIAAIRQEITDKQAGCNDLLGGSLFDYSSDR